MPQKEIIKQEIVNICKNGRSDLIEELKTLLIAFEREIISEQTSPKEPPKKIKNPLDFTNTELYECFPSSTKAYAMHALERGYRCVPDNKKSKKQYMAYIYDIAHGKRKARGVGQTSIVALRKILHIDEGGID